MTGSFLDQSYLGDTDVIQRAAHLPAVGQEADPQEMVTLPGGIVLPKRTLIIGALLIAIALLVYRQRQKRIA